MRSRRLLLLVAFLLSPPASAVAAPQDPAGPAPVQASAAPPDAVAPPLIQAGLGFMMGIPVGDFQDNVDFAGGISGHVAFGVGRSPITIGAEATYLWYGTETRDVPLVGLPDLAVEVETSNDIFLLHGRVRAQKPEGRVRPYVDGLAGFNYLITTTTVHGDVSCSGFQGIHSCSEDGDSTTNLDDLVFSAGGGAGIMFAFSDNPRAARLDLSVRYLYGGEAAYLTEGDIRWQDGPAVFVPHRSRTDMLLVQIGVAFGR